MTPRRKKVSMLVVVSVPVGTSAFVARREVRELINEQCNFYLNPGDVRVAKLSPITVCPERWAGDRTAFIGARKP